MIRKFGSTAASDDVVGKPWSGFQTGFVIALLDLAQRLAEQSQSGKVDLPDLGRRARRLLEATARPDEGEKLF